MAVENVRDSWVVQVDEGCVFFSPGLVLVLSPAELLDAIHEHLDLGGLSHVDDGDKPLNR